MTSPRFEKARSRPAAFAAAAKADVLMLPDFERADRIGEFWATKKAAPSRLLIECEEDRVLRAVLVGILREADR